jgi:hypothetical protein
MKQHEILILAKGKESGFHGGRGSGGHGNFISDFPFVQELSFAAFDRRQIGGEKGCLNGGEERREHGRAPCKLPMKPSKPHGISSSIAPMIGWTIINGSSENRGRQTDLTDASLDKALASRVSAGISFKRIFWFLTADYVM